LVPAKPDEQSKYVIPRRLVEQDNIKTLLAC